MALDPSNCNNWEQLALKGLIFAGDKLTRFSFIDGSSIASQRCQRGYRISGKSDPVDPF